MNSLQDRLKAIGNLSNFAKKTGLPLRTLNRIRAGNNISVMTVHAVCEALRKYKEPK